MTGRSPRSRVPPRPQSTICPRCCDVGSPQFVSDASQDPVGGLPPTAMDPPQPAGSASVTRGSDTESIPSSSSARAFSRVLSELCHPPDDLFVVPPLRHLISLKFSTYHGHRLMQKRRVVGQTPPKGTRRRRD